MLYTVLAICYVWWLHSQLHALEGKIDELKNADNELRNADNKLKSDLTSAIEELGTREERRQLAASNAATRAAKVAVDGPQMILIMERELLADPLVNSWGGEVHVMDLKLRASASGDEFARLCPKRDDTYRLMWDLSGLHPLRLRHRFAEYMVPEVVFAREGTELPAKPKPSLYPRHWS